MYEDCCDYDKNYEFNSALSNLIEFELSQRNEQQTNEIKELKVKLEQVITAKYEIESKFIGERNKNKKQFDNLIAENAGYKIDDLVYTVQVSKYGESIVLKCPHCERGYVAKEFVDGGSVKVKCEKCNASGAFYQKYPHFEIKERQIKYFKVDKYSTKACYEVYLEKDREVNGETFKTKEEAEIYKCEKNLNIVENNCREVLKKIGVKSTPETNKKLTKAKKYLANAKLKLEQQESESEDAE